MAGLLTALCVISFISGIWVNKMDSMTSGFLLVVSAILVVGTAIVHTIKQSAVKS